MADERTCAHLVQVAPTQALPRGHSELVLLEL